MDADCGNCHIQNGDATLMNDSRNGFGCLGCHGRVDDGAVRGRGLRQHHRVTGASTCSGCHDSPEAPLPESVAPPYYGGPLTRVDDPCNSSPATLEDWSGDGVGLDNDGDNLYDGNDPDCQAGNQPPVAGFTFEQTKCTLDVQFTDASSDPDAGDAVAEWEWDFDGDGSADSTEQNPTWTFGAAGSFDVELKVKDSSGEVGSISQMVTVVANQPPTAAFSIQKDGFGVQFTDQSDDPDGEITTWQWDFGDGSTMSDPNPGHTYAGAGTYPVSLLVVDDCGESSTVEEMVTIEPNPVFQRGDANADGGLDLSDAIGILFFKFMGDTISCVDAADVDDNGQVEVTDVIDLLGHLFLGGDPPAEPFSACDIDPTADELTCESFNCPDI